MQIIILTIKEANEFPNPGRVNQRKKFKQTQTQIHKKEKKKITLVKLKTEAIE